jgi:outer membrane immunogenic protein
MSRGRPERITLATAALAAALASSSATAGLLDPAPAYPSKFVNTALLYDWTGFYVGLNAGGTFGHVNWQSDPDLTSGTSNPASGLIGGTIGYNAQNFGSFGFGSFVFGTEFDMDWREFSATIPAASCALSSPSATNCEYKSFWMGTARLRFGYAIGNYLPYATVGVSLGDYNASVVGAPVGTTKTVTFNWTAGAGLEFALGGPLTAKLEYLYVNHTNTACDTPCVGIFLGGNGTPIHIGANENQVRVGLNYRLWGR